MNLLRKAFEHSEGAGECKTTGTTATESNKIKRPFDIIKRSWEKVLLWENKEELSK